METEAEVARMIVAEVDKEILNDLLRSKKEVYYFSLDGRVRNN